MREMCKKILFRQKKYLLKGVSTAALKEISSLLKEDVTLKKLESAYTGTLPNNLIRAIVKKVDESDRHTLIKTVEEEIRNDLRN